MARQDDIKSQISKKKSDLEFLQVEVAQLPQPPPEFLRAMGSVREEVQNLTEELELLEKKEQSKALRQEGQEAPLVFVSYSHKDEIEKEDLLTNLRVLERAGILRLWIDDHIQGGANWREEIEAAVSQATVAVLLVSNSFLLSDFIGDEEVPALLERRAEEGITVFPIIAKYSHWWAFNWLTEMNVRPKNGLPIWRGQDSDIDKELYEITREIAKIVMEEGAKEPE